MPANCMQQIQTQTTARRVLVSIDQTEQSNQRVQWYFNNLMQPNDQVIFVHIIQPKRNNSLLGLRLPKSPVLIGTQMQICRKLLNEAKSLCRDYVCRASSMHGITARAFVYVDKQPSSKLTRVIRSHGADLVLLTSEDKRILLMYKSERKQSDVTDDGYEALQMDCPS
ncbi:unnamed protein product [Echinostoma caproni]|uniref:Usp domain-containing protein n=1 Tax=Echinostoma caproni TaxID=27848 RepID=A0A183AXR1_9TREM|nr:unnamed protein product [Echinostoma caproni]